MVRDPDQYAQHIRDALKSFAELIALPQLLIFIEKLFPIL